MALHPITDPASNIAVDVLRGFPDHVLLRHGKQLKSDITKTLSDLPILSASPSNPKSTKEKALEWMGRNDVILSQKAFDELIAMLPLDH